MESMGEAGQRRVPDSQRKGPRPLMLHLSLAQTIWRGSSAAWPSWNSGWQNLNPALRAEEEALRLELLRAEADPAAAADALERQVRKRQRELLDGIEAYRRHPYRRALEDPPVLWSEGSARLLDYGGSGPPLLLVPSLINRGYILDLSETCSLARWLAESGFRVFLLDWGTPGEIERGFSLTDYIAGYLEASLDALRSETGQNPLLVGYCMGGLLALAAAQRRAEDLRGLVLLATPWDFHAIPGQAALGRAALMTWGPLMDLMGELPVDVLQSLFTMVDPMATIRKFRNFAALDPESEQARAFVALEDWLNDGVPLAAPVARECLGAWYAGNTTQMGAWRIAGRRVLPQRIELPTLCVIPAEDRIVPPASALALAEALPNVDVQRPKAGHIGMVAGRSAASRIWGPLRDWMRDKAVS
ncbi:alpha/beta fold hydrolase [Fodinicurvata halophila]|uniref:Alpha/beta fold hydrolase n=1 Tax=Fodinicurvata halophila TaxID=1419723 RepID=A0ABV8UH98_9PROT